MVDKVYKILIITVLKWKLVEWYWQWKTDVPGGTPLPLPLCPPASIPGLRDPKWSSAKQYMQIKFPPHSEHSGSLTNNQPGHAF